VLTFPFGEAPASVADDETREVRMELLTIGAFAKASRLSPKALRLYDELDLLRPAISCVVADVVETAA
jgi:PPM family protein phosphatase